MSRASIRRSIGAALLLLALVTNQVAGFFTQELIAEAAILAIFALSLDLLATCGLVSFGHAGLLGVGAYMFAGLTVKLGGPPLPAIGIAMLAGALAAFLAGYLHQDFVVTHKTPAGALQAFLADANARERDALREEWRQLLADLDGLAWREAARAFTALGGAWQPSSRRALLALFEQLT